MIINGVNMEDKVSFATKLGIQYNTLVIYVPKGSRKLGKLESGDEVKVTIERVV